MHDLASGIGLMLSQATSEYEAYASMREKELSVGQPVTLGKVLSSCSHLLLACDSPFLSIAKRRHLGQAACQW